MIKVKDLSFTYPERKGATLKQISFTIQKGSIFGFLGPSGAGKSTTLSILIGLIKGYEGSVQIFNQEINRNNEDFFERIGVAFEQPNFYLKFTALENLQLFARLYKKKDIDIKSWLVSFGLEQAMHQRVEHFSKGMKMRLNVCRALLHDPDVLFMDEPTSGLDPVNTRKVMNLLRQEKERGKTIIINTHNMHVADEICDTVAFMVNGQIKNIDTPKELKLAHGQQKVTVVYLDGSQMSHSEEFALAKLGENLRFLHILKEKRIITIHSQEASLEDIFIKVTGSRLQDVSEGIV